MEKIDDMADAQHENVLLEQSDKMIIVCVDVLSEM